jgi:hypothetical protein
VRDVITPIEFEARQARAALREAERQVAALDLRHARDKDARIGEELRALQKVFGAGPAEFSPAVQALRAAKEQSWAELQRAEGKYRAADRAYDEAAAFADREVDGYTPDELPEAHPGPRKDALSAGAKLYRSSCPKHPETVRYARNGSCWLCEAARKPRQMTPYGGEPRLLTVERTERRRARKELAPWLAALEATHESLRAACRAAIEAPGADEAVRAELSKAAEVRATLAELRGRRRSRAPVEVDAAVLLALPQEKRTRRRAAIRRLLG